MNTEFFIARRLIFNKGKENNISGPIVKIAIAGIALGIAVMIMSVAIVQGFKSEIRNKIIGFGSHIQITNFDSNLSYETHPIARNQDFTPAIEALKGVRHVQIYATKPGIIKNDAEMQGIILKGVGPDFDWSFFSQHMKSGSVFEVNDSVKTNEIIISDKLASLLKVEVGEKVLTYFIERPPRMRKFTVAGIYSTGLEEFDKTFIICDIGHVQKLNNWEESQISGFEILIDDFDELEKIGDEVNLIAGMRFNEDGSKLKVQTIKEKEPVLFDWIELVNVNVWVILVLMVLVAGVNMISGLLIMILERTNLIGILKALGTENWSIRKIFLYNGLYLIGLGVFWGNLIGLVISLLQKNLGIVKLDPASYYVDVVPIQITAIDFLWLNAGTIVITMVMLLLPTYLVTKISPVKAIRFN